ncbi:hypothetical protein [Marinoscillum sp.]|uniref:hypothetical protein n=1 Tax=Marinoscillum sp. TaxID=2024838 RepID=UPI003BA8D94B
MKSYRLVFVFVASLMMLTSCLEDNLDFPEDDRIVTSPSTAMISLLNTLSDRGDFSCFAFVYPIDLRLSNGVLVEASSKASLKEISQDQNSGIHISEVSFPLLITVNDQLNSIDNEQELFELLQNCELPTLRTALERTHKQCFDFAYPISMLDKNSIEVTLNSREEYIQFYYNNQPTSYQPSFIFPVSVQVFSEEAEKALNNTFELYEVINACSGCPELFMDYVKRNDGLFEFTASVNKANAFDWFIDNQFIQSGTPDSNTLTKKLEPGFHEVCIKAFSEDCVEGEVYCLEFVVEDPCPSLFFDYEERSYGHYFFEANFERMFDLESYKWLINGVIKDEEGTIQGDSSDHQFEYQFEPGRYTVCLKTTTDECPEGAEYCKEINVECVEELSYAWDLETFGYTFTADFELRDQVTYIWYAYIGDTLVKEEVREAGSNDDHDFLVEMERGVEYTICLRQDGGCADKEICEEWVFE